MLQGILSTQFEILHVILEDPDLHILVHSVANSFTNVYLM